MSVDNPNLSVPAIGASFKDILTAEKRPWLIVLVLAIAINIAGITTDFFTNDPGLYGLIARNMVQSHNYTDLIYRGKDWLDKPHFPFWMVALSFKVFGVGTVAYKLPGLLFYFMSVVYTYKLAKKFYGFDTALIAILILLTAQHTIMSNTDVRAEPYIMGLLMGSVYHFYKLKEKFSIADLLIASLFAACAVMTKGIYLLIPIGFAIIGDYLFKKDFKGLFQWRWLMAVVLVALFTLPEIYTLYIQFDIHPEKVVFNHTHVSGIKWFLWDSQFGRFSNTGYIIRPDRDYFFFLHTLLWAFAPWAFLLYYSLFISIKKIVKGVVLVEYITLSGSLLMLIIFSVSQFQLPFYTNILFPFFAIITAVYVKQVFDDGKSKVFIIVQYVTCIVLMILVGALIFYFYIPLNMRGYTAFAGGMCGTLFGSFFRKRVVRKVFLLTCGVAIFVNAYLIVEIYRVLLFYKGDVNAAHYINKNVNADKKVIASFEVPDAFEFYTNRPVSFVNIDSVIAKKNKNEVVLVEDTLLKNLFKNNIPFKLLKSFDNYPNENLTKQFLLKDERNKTLNHYFLIFF
ncbi:MAG: glycosyltransferase family 39 protein [Mucilaginibacter sp.]|uniref:ArnT family glycosyltransferase n=1 Tax=Mucilaginibacter sp. TaxID=1882438 RepID=UPI003264BD68